MSVMSQQREPIPPIVTTAPGTPMSRALSRTPRSALSPGAYSNRSVTTIGPMPDVSNLNEVLVTMRGTMAQLEEVFGTLGQQTNQMSTLGPTVNSDHQIAQLKRQLALQDRRQEDRIQEIKELLRDVLKEQISEHLRYHVHEMIRQQIQERVAAQVKKQLLEQIPMKLRDQVANHKVKLAGVKRSLHNSEARRANALLRSNHVLEALHPLLTPSGGPSMRFPKNLASLFALSSSGAKQLVLDYELELDPNDSRERNLNNFMNHIGVGFQMVPAPIMPLVTSA